MAKIISFFNHKGRVGKTTLVHNIGQLLADKGCKVLLIDADPQMNLTACLYGLSTSIDYSTDDDSKWSQYTEKYISLPQYLNEHFQDMPKSGKAFFRKTSKFNDGGYIDLISGSINLSELESDLYGIIKNKNAFTDTIPYKFEQEICNQYKDSGTTVNIDKELGQYAISLKSIQTSYNNIADGLIRLLQKNDK